MNLLVTFQSCHISYIVPILALPLIPLVSMFLYFFFVGFNVHSYTLVMRHAVTEASKLNTGIFTLRLHQKSCYSSRDRTRTLGLWYR